MLLDNQILVDKVYSPEDFYVDIQTKKIKERPQQIINIVETTLTNLRNPSEILVQGNIYKCADSTLELELDPNQTYKITVMAFPYKDFTTEIIT